MLLDRIDIDNHGPLNRVELGPFSEFLNLVSAPEGAGKTAIARFVRDSLIRREYPLGMMSSSTGRVVWADRNGKIHCRRENDGTATGRRTVEFETRGDVAHRFDWLHGTWIDGIADSTDATRALESIRIPESIVDGIVTDTAVTSVSRIVHAALRSGLGDPALFAGLPIGRTSVSGTSPDQPVGEVDARRALRDELARVEAELAGLAQTQPAVMGQYSAPLQDSFKSHSETSVRRSQLHARLAYLNSIRIHRYGQQDLNRNAASIHYVASEELSRLHERIWQLRVQHSELTRWLEHLQSDRNRARYTAPITASPYASNAYLGIAAATRKPDPFGAIPAHPDSIVLDAQLKGKLLEVDSQIVHWRRTLAELVGLREFVTAHRDLEPDFYHSTFRGQLPLSEPTLRRGRFDYFLHSLDDVGRQFNHRPLTMADWEQYSRSSRQANWPYEADMRIDAVVRQLDSLAAIYGGSQPNPLAWYQIPAELSYRGSVSLVRTLMTIREELQNVRRQGFQFASASINPAAQTLTLRREAQLLDLHQSERWITETIGQLIDYRNSLIGNRRLAEQVRYPSWLNAAYQRQNWSAWYIQHLDDEVAGRTRELNSLTMELERDLARAAELRRQMRSLPVLGPAESTLGLNEFAFGFDPAAVEAEINAVKHELQMLDGLPLAAPVDSPRVRWLQRRRDELVAALGVSAPSNPSAIPLASEASQWLVRLSGGRLHRVDWRPEDFTTASQDSADAMQRSVTTIDGRPEPHCPASDRALAALAVRLASADLLARTGRPVPVIIEAHRELLRPQAGAFAQGTTYPQSIGVDASFPAEHSLNLAVIAALDDYTKNGRQVILLASDAIFADQVTRRGGKVFQIHGERLAHPHRPVWRPHYQTETYVGPYPHQPVPVNPSEPMFRSDAIVDQYYDQYFDGIPAGSTLADLNRNLDTIWQEAYGITPYAGGPYRTFAGDTSSAHLAASLYDDLRAMPTNEESYRAHHQHHNPVDVHRQSNQLWNDASANWRDGYYFADSYTTETPTKSQSQNDSVCNCKPAATDRRSKESPFFLTVDSSIDQAPSIDAVASARLRKLDVTHVNHLLSQDPNRLADALGLGGVTAATIRRWQSECRLVCQVPQLRGFDARILVGCGITDAAELASTDPNHLLDRVEAFLATERGQRILLSGTSYELSRITSWIATANVVPEEDLQYGIRDHHTVEGRVIRDRDDREHYERNLDHDRYEYEFVNDHGEVVRVQSPHSRSDLANRSRSSLSDRRSRSRRSSSNGRSTGQSRTNRSSRSSSSRRRSSRSSTGRSSTGRSNMGGTSASRTSQGRTNSDRSGYSRRSRSNGSGHSHRENGYAYDASEYSRSERDRGGYSEGRSSRQTRRTRSERSSENRQSTDQSYSYEQRSRERSDRSSSSNSHESERELRFYLERESPVVDAPSIGARMAEKLNAVGIYTVDDLLNADAESLAEQLDHRRIDADVITMWQNQAILVCRIPMLRGHDAQLLVAAEITTPEEVSQYAPDDLFALIDPIARSSEGKRILRGGKLPDLEEITDWINFAGQNRELMAA